VRVLIAYATAHGSTRGVAKRVAATLESAGLTIELASVDQVGDTSGFNAFVLGSALHNQAWLREAEDFVVTTREELARQPVWLFSVGMPDALGAPLRRFARTEEPKQLAAFREAFHPREHRLFSGVVRPDQLPAAGKLVFGLMGGRYGDFRDWQAIDRWADGIARELQSPRDANAA